MTFDVKITAKDLYRFTMYYTLSSIMGKIGIAFSIFCLGAAAYTYGSAELQNTLALVVMGLLFTVVNPVMLYVKCLQRYKKQKSSYEVPTHYSLNKKGFTISQDIDSLKISWDELYSIVARKHAIYLCFDPMHAQIISTDELGPEKTAQLKQFLANNVKSDYIRKKGL